MIQAGVLIGPYRLAEPIGSGGMGEVWRALDTRLDREVALKFLRQDAVGDRARRERFVREAKSASALNHPGIVTIYEIDTRDGVDFIAMEFVRGKSLHDIIGQGPVPVERAITLTIALAEALAKAHRANIVHRDIKPANLMVSDDGYLKVLDFGLAKLYQAAGPVDADSETLTAVQPLTQLGIGMGTPGYMPPEQLLGDAVDARADVFAVGVVLHEMLTAIRPFTGATKASVMRSVLTDPPSDLPDRLPNVEPLRQILAKCLAKSPLDRYADAGELLADLRRLQSGQTAQVQAPRLPEIQPPPVPATPPPLYRNPTLLAVFAVVIAAAGIWLSFRNRGSGAEPAAPTSLYQQARADLARYDRKGSIERAIKSLESVLEQEPANAAAFAALSEAYSRRNVASRDPQWVSLALESGRKAVEINPDLAAAHVSLGMALLEDGKTPQAAESFRRATELDPRSAMAALGLGRVQLAEGKRSEAEATLRKAVDLDPSDWRAPTELGTMFFRQARYEEALTVWQQASAKTPDNARLLRNLAAAYHMLDRFEDAASTLQKALEYEPNAQVWANLGTARFFQGQYLAAVSAMEKAVELNPNSFLYWGNLGDAYRWAPGRKDKAPETYTRALQLVEAAIKRNPKDLEAKSSRAVYLAKAGNPSGAKAQIAEVLRTIELTPGIRFKCALASEMAGDRDRALSLLESAVQAGYSQREVTREPDLVNLRADLRYHRMAARLKPARQ